MFGTATTGTSARTPDLDGDEYWDGWIGVYNTTNSSNVILYREHLRDDDDSDGNMTDDGVQGVETVPAQAGTHTVGTNNPGANVTGNSSRDHSNIHIGELYWGTNPTKRADTPSPSFTFEVDFYAGSNNRLWTNTSSGIRSAWTRRIERNYALYGMNIELVPSDVVTKKELPNGSLGDVEPPFSEVDIARIATEEHEISGSQYIFVTDRADLHYFKDYQAGVNLYFLGGLIEQRLPVGVDPLGIALFTRNNRHQKALTKTTIHEIAHSLQIGEADDSCLKRFGKAGEIYSGETGNITDSTSEGIRGKTRWSVMGSGWRDPMDMPPMDGNYYAFSIEELLTTFKSDTPCI